MGQPYDLSKPVIGPQVAPPSSVVWNIRAWYVYRNRPTLEEYMRETHLNVNYK